VDFVKQIWGGISEARRAKAGSPKGRERRLSSWEGAGSPLPPARGLGSTMSSSGGPGRSPAAKGFSGILNTQDDLSGQQYYGPLAKHTFLASWPSGAATGTDTHTHTHPLRDAVTQYRSLNVGEGNKSGFKD